MPLIQRPTSQEIDDLWAMSETQLVRSGFKFVGWLLCGDTFTRSTVPYVRGDYTPTLTFSPGSMVYNNFNNTVVYPSQGVQHNTYSYQYEGISQQHMEMRERQAQYYAQLLSSPMGSW